MTTHNDKAGTTPLQGNAGGASPALSTVRHHQAPCQCWARGCLLYSPLGSTQGLQMMSQPKSAQVKGGEHPQLLGQEQLVVDSQPCA